jgi:hypothetical protein
MERIRELLGIMNDIPKGICISPTDDVKKDYITTIPSIFLTITDSYLSELGLDKQTYSERELNENLQLISKHPECIIEKYYTMNWTESTYDTITHIADYISADYNNEHDYYYCKIYFIYNNIIVFIVSDSEISEPSIQYKYVKSQIDIGDLDKIKKAFKFLSAFYLLR